jgi:hypothetical protein
MPLSLLLYFDYILKKKVSQAMEHFGIIKGIYWYLLLLVRGEIIDLEETTGRSYGISKKNIFLVVTGSTYRTITGSRASPLPDHMLHWY